jgi:hypothetical protein
MSETIKILGVSSAFVIVTFVMFGLIVFGNQLFDNSRVVVYNCSISEISPDIPLQVKEQCRKLIRESSK